MTISRVSTYGNYQRTVAEFSQVSARISTVQQQISSGQKATDFKGLDGYVEQFTGLEALQKKQQQYIDDNTVSISRLQTQQQAVGAMIEIGTQMQSLMVGRRSADGAGGRIGFSEQMSDLQDSLSKQLNTSFGDRFLFGGTTTDLPPVITDPTPGNVTDGVPDSSYYQGSQQNMTIRPDTGTSMPLSVRADDPAFQKMYAGLALAQKGDAANNDDMLKQAYDLIHDGLAGINAVQTQLNDNITTLKDINTQHSTSNLYLKGVTEDISSTDQVKASTQLATDQTILQASFQAFSTINNLQLLDYLK